jgi:hypothetical protein
MIGIRRALLGQAPAVYATPAYVQGGYAAASTSYPRMLAFPGNTAPGSLLVVALFYAIAVNPAVTDSQGNTYAAATAKVGRARLFYALNTLGGANAVTVNYDGAPSTNALIVAEYSGVAIADALDRTSTQNGGTATACGSGFTADSTQANELLIGQLGLNSAASALTAGANYAMRQTDNTRQALEDRTVSAIAAYNATFTWTTGSGWGCIIATFKAKRLA